MLTYVGEAALPGASSGRGKGDGTVCISTSILRMLVPALVMGTKEKNTMVRVACETALVTLLQLRQGDSLYQVNGLLLLKRSASRSVTTTSIGSCYLMWFVCVRGYICIYCNLETTIVGGYKLG